VQWASSVFTVGQELTEVLYKVLPFLLWTSNCSDSAPLVQNGHRLPVREKLLEVLRFAVLNAWLNCIMPCYLRTLQ